MRYMKNNIQYLKEEAKIYERGILTLFNTSDLAMSEKVRIFAL